MTHVRLRANTAAGWTSVNPVLYDGELGWEKDTLKGKVGDGVTAWNSLPYAIVPVPAAPAASPVLSVAGRVGAVVLTKADVSLGNIDNTSDANKPVSTAQAAALAPIASPTFTGSPKAPTPFSTDNTTSIATTAWVKALAYAPLASPTFTGDPKAPTVVQSDNDTSIATTAYVRAATSTYVEANGATSYSPTGTADVVCTDLGFSYTTLTANERWVIGIAADVNPTSAVTQFVDVYVAGVLLFTLTVPSGPARGYVTRQMSYSAPAIGSKAVQIRTRLSAAGTGILRSSLSGTWAERK